MKNFDLSEISVILFVGQDTSNGHVFFCDGKWYVWLPVEAYTSNMQRDIFVMHEIIHALQYLARPEFYFHTRREKNDVGRELMTEGLATYLTMEVGGYSLEQSLWADYISPKEREEWVRECQKRERELNHLALNAWRKNETTELFYANDPNDITKYRAGYYLGAKIIERITNEHHLDKKGIVSMSREALGALFVSQLEQ